MDLVKTLVLYMVMLVSSATDASPNITPIPKGAVLTTPTPYVTEAPKHTPPPSSAPTKAPPAVKKYPTLFVGEKGTNVRKLQEKLKELGYLEDKVDGAYGRNTQEAVKAFQKKHGLEVDGVAGNQTQTMLFENKNVVSPDQTLPPDIQTPVPSTVEVPVYYFDDESNKLLYSSTELCYGQMIIEQDSAKVPEGYTLVGPKMITVNVSNGKAKPETVIFRYQKPKATATPPPAISEYDVPVKYVLEDGTVLYTTSIQAKKGQNTRVYCDKTKVKDNYKLVSTSPISVRVTIDGTVSPKEVVFTFK